MYTLFSNTPHRSARQRRQQQDKLRAVKTLGEADDDDGDMMAWVAKSRTLEEKAKAEARAKAAELERKLAEQEAEEQEADPASLAGLKVKGAVEDLMEGESLVMTLEDAPILTERMELHDGEDVLVNVAKVRGVWVYYGRAQQQRVHSGSSLRGKRRGGRLASRARQCLGRTASPSRCWTSMTTRGMSRRWRLMARVPSTWRRSGGRMRSAQSLLQVLFVCVR